MAAEDFYVRYYVGHKGKFGHEFLEFEFRPDGKVLLDARVVTAHVVCGGGMQLPCTLHHCQHNQHTCMCSMQLRYANNSNYKNDTMIR